MSIKRIERFMNIEELPDQPIDNEPKNPSKDGVIIELREFSAQWEEGKTRVLQDVNLRLREGSLTAVVGRVGSGKSSLLHAILREVSSSGELSVRGTISYASQEPWIFGSSFKQNVLFGRPMDAKRYARVVDACQLRRDLDTLPHGDETMLGEKGINLSGGQCARLNLARAIYRDADVYLLDDPLSAVDAPVGRRVFADCIRTFLKGKTVVLVTHQLHFLENVDHIVLLDQGRVQTTADSLQELNESCGVNLIQLTKTFEDRDDQSDLPARLEKTSESAENLAPSSVAQNNNNVKAYKESCAEKKSRTRSISMKTYLSYILACKNVPLVLLVLTTSVLHQSVASGGDYFLAFWVNAQENRTSSCKENSCASADDDWYIYFYTGLTLAHIVLCLLQSWSFFEMSMKVANNLHANMFSSVVSTTIDFFTTNPLGRIMNR